MMLFRIYVSGKKVPRFNENKMEEYCNKIIDTLFDEEKCKSIFMKIIDFNDRKTFERKETTDLLLNKSAELKRYIDGQ